MLTMLSVRLHVNSRLSVVKFWEESKLICEFLTVQGVHVPNHMLFMDQLYI